MSHFKSVHLGFGDMHHILNKSDLADYSDTSEYNHNKQPRFYKLNHFVLPLFCLEAVALGCVGALAYYLRFTDVFPLHESLVNCSDHEIGYPFLNGTSLLTDVPVEVVYSVALLLPLVTMLIGELGYWLFSSKPKKVVRAHCIGLKLHLMPRRFCRYTGLFLLGIFTTSIFTDLVKLLTGRPRPYFLNVCGITCSLPDGTLRLTDHEHCIEDDLRFARSSFPSFYSSLALYSASFTSIYMHNLLTARGARLLRPIMVFGVMGLAIFVGICRYMMHKNHWQDVLVGYLLGLSLAVYLGVFAGNCFLEKVPPVDHLLPFRRKSGASSPTIQLPDPKSPFFSWFPIPRVTFKSKPSQYINGFNHHGTDYPQDPVPVVYHPDLNRSIDNFSRTSNPHVMQHY